MTVPPDRAALRATLERFAREGPGSVAYDDAGSALLDVFSGKVLPVDWSRIEAVERRSDAATGRPYLVLRRDDGVEIALTDAGIAFAPVTDATGPIRGLPPAVCFRDVAYAEGQLEHFLVGHPGEPPDAAHVTTLLFCIAAVDGARAAGFDVSPDERRLERTLGELEARKRG